MHTQLTPIPAALVPLSEWFDAPYLLTHGAHLAHLLTVKRLSPLWVATYAIAHLGGARIDPIHTEGAPVMAYTPTRAAAWVSLGRTEARTPGE